MFSTEFYRLRQLVVWGVLQLAVPSSIGLSDEPNSKEPSFAYVASEKELRAGWMELQAGLPEAIAVDKLLARIELSPSNLRWLGAISYGDDRSRSVAVALTEESEPRLFIDLDRDRVFDESERLDHSGANVWATALDAEYLQEDSRYARQPQSILLKQDAASGRVSIQTAGVMQGWASYQGESCEARLEDRNANGRWFDSEDRLFVDLNHDGRIDALLERIPAQGMKVIRGTLTAIEGDKRGRFLALREVLEKGMLKPELNFVDPSAEVQSLSARLASPSGFQIEITEAGRAIEVPTGEYFVSSLNLTVKSKSGTFHYVFASDSPTAQVVAIAAEEEASIDLVGELMLSASISVVVQGGQSVTQVTPMLRTQSGLYLANCESGLGLALAENRLNASVFSDAKLLGIGSSGFS